MDIVNRKLSYNRHGDVLLFEISLLYPCTVFEYLIFFTVANAIL